MLRTVLQSPLPPTYSVEMLENFTLEAPALTVNTKEKQRSLLHKKRIVSKLVDPIDKEFKNIKL